VKPQAFLRKSLNLLTSINEKIREDTFISLERFRHYTLAFNNGEGDGELVEFWLKTAVRTFTAQVEGITFAMRSAVLDGADAGLLLLDNRTRAILSEKRYHKSTDTVLDKRKHYPFEMRIRFAFEYYPRIFGSDWKLDTESDSWRGFKELIWARNKITHPELLEDLYPIEAMRLLHPSTTWFFFCVYKMLEDCGSKMGIPPKGSGNSAAPIAFPAEAFNRSVRDPDFYEQIAEGGHSLRLALIMLQRLSRDASKAWDLWSNGLQGLEGMSGVKPLSSFGARILVRTYFSEIEGLTLSWRRVLNDAQKRSEISISDDEQRLMEVPDVCERLANTARLFSLKLGYGRPVDTLGDGYRSFQIVLRFRNRITHPKRPEDLDVKPGTVKSILASASWFRGQVLEAVEVAPNYWERSEQGN